MWIEIQKIQEGIDIRYVTVREGSVDWNHFAVILFHHGGLSLSVRAVWIEIDIIRILSSVDGVTVREGSVDWNLMHLIQ